MLVEYRSDPVFAIRPAEAMVVGPPTVEKACIDVRAQDSFPRLGEPAAKGGLPGATSAEVSMFFALNVGFTQAELTAMYDPGIRARGWAPEPRDLPPLFATSDQQAVLYYCKLVNQVPSFLLVYERYIGTPDRRANEFVSPSPDGLWPEAGSLEVHITAIQGRGCSPI